MTTTSDARKRLAEKHADRLTVDQLDALPECSIVLTHPPTCLVKTGRDSEPYGGQWRSPYVAPGAHGEFMSSTEAAAVATRVLYDPSTEESR